MRILLSFLCCTIFVVDYVYTQCQEFKTQYVNPAWVLKENDPDSALAIVNKGISRKGEIDEEVCRKEIDNAYFIRGYALRNLGYYDRAFADFKIALESRKIQRDTLGMVKILNACSSNEKERENFQKALSFSRQAIELLNELPSGENLSTVGNTYITATNILIEMDSFSLADVERYIEEAKKAYNREPGTFEKEEVTANHNLAVAYNKKRMLSKAQGLFEDCLAFYTKAADTFNIALIENELGEIQGKKGHYTNARVYFETSITHFEALKNEVDINLPLLNLANNYLREENPELAIATADKIIHSTAEGLDMSSRIQRIYIDAYLQLGNNKQLIAHLMRLDTIHQEIIAKKYPYQAVEKARLEELLQRSIDKNKRNIFFGIFGSIFLLCFSFLLIRIQKRQTEMHRINSEIQNQEKKFQEKIAGILKTYSKEFEEKRINLDAVLHDDICPMIIAIKRQLEYVLQTEKNSTIEQAITITDQVYYKTSRLINREDVLPTKSEWLQNIGLLVNQQKRMGLFDVKEHIHLKAEEIPLDVGMQLAVITNVLLENIEKHAQANQASISIIKDNGTLLMVVDDDGNGFVPEQINGKNASKHGIGLKNVEYRVEKMLKGSIKIDSSPGKGATISIEIPLNK